MFPVLFGAEDATSSNGSSEMLPRLIREYRHSRQLQRAQAQQQLSYSSSVLSPTGDHSGHRTPLQRRMSLIDQNNAKHLQTASLLLQHSLKAKVGRYQRAIDELFTFIQTGCDESLLCEAYYSLAHVMENAWVLPRIGQDLVFSLCDNLRELGHFATFVQHFCDIDGSDEKRLAAGAVLAATLSMANRDYLVQNQLLSTVISNCLGASSVTSFKTAIAVLEEMFKHSSETTRQLINMGVLDFIVNTCKDWKPHYNVETLRNAAMALANAALYGDTDCHKLMAAKKIPEWLFLLLSNRDDTTVYYAGVAVCRLACNRKLEPVAALWGTLDMVSSFVAAHKPDVFLGTDHRLLKGSSQSWLRRLIPMLRSSKWEVAAVAAFHFCMEATIKQSQDRLDIFRELAIIPILKEVASSPTESAARLASQALQIIGEKVPRRLSQQVPLWTVENVQDWVSKIGFSDFSDKFVSQKVDGDLLLLMTEDELKEDIGVTSTLLRKRFMRELESLKLAADYSCCDPSRLDKFLVSVNPGLSLYTYRMLEHGIDRKMLPHLTHEILENLVGISNPIHRIRLLQSIQGCKTEEEIEIGILRKNIDIFISYRRSTGNQLASLLRVLLQLRGYKVFIDVDRLSSGQFDSSLFNNIRAARHFVLVLTEGSFDRVVNDDACDDWVHKEIFCAMENQKNIIPIFDAGFQFPDENDIPMDIRKITKFNGIRWVHEYQDACVSKLERFLHGDDGLQSDSNNNLSGSSNMLSSNLKGSNSNSPTLKRRCNDETQLR